MKLTNIEKTFAVIFAVIVLLELFSSQMQEVLPFHFSPKPLILLSLIIYYLSQCKPLDRLTNSFMTLALIFSLGGDILLMFVDANANMFIMGLVSFLIAHIMYIVVFSKKRGRLNPLSLILLLSAYTIGILFLLFDGLGDLLIPVIVYMMVILSMVVFAYMRKDKVANVSYYLVLIGAIFFVLSDSILAINKFYEPLVYSHFLIMSTYATAQFLITLGILRQNQ